MDGHKHQCMDCGKIVSCASDCDEGPTEETMCDLCYTTLVGIDWETRERLRGEL